MLRDWAAHSVSLFLFGIRPATKNIDIGKKWNIKIFGIDEAVVNVNLQISGFIERLK